MITKEQYLQALETHFQSKKIINEFHSQINKSLNEVGNEKQLNKYSKDTNLLSLLMIKYGIPNKDVFSTVTSNFLAMNTNSQYYNIKEDALFNENSTVNDLIKAYYNKELHKRSRFGNKTKNEIKMFIETQVI